MPRGHDADPSDPFSRYAALQHLRRKHGDFGPPRPEVAAALEQLRERWSALSDDELTASPADALHRAIRSKDMLQVRRALESGADPDRPAKSHWPPPLFEAIDTGESEFVVELLDRGADIDVQGLPDFTPLMYAIDTECVAAHERGVRPRLHLIELLLLRGARQDILGSGYTARSLAHAYRCPEVVDLLDRYAEAPPT